MQSSGNISARDAFADFGRLCEAEFVIRTTKDLDYVDPLLRLTTRFQFLYVTIGTGRNNILEELHVSVNVMPYGLGRLVRSRCSAHSDWCISLVAEICNPPHLVVPGAKHIRSSRHIEKITKDRFPRLMENTTVDFEFSEKLKLDLNQVKYPKTQDISYKRATSGAEHHVV
ncbi:hypothetical protein CVT25_006956 [Psilocybe cyanescens]|uniref:Uncharacterized protein n=1 Tax=Psilocybe cyanescens TaxID=93625 RepID=A0A409VSM5_PSICY|nr:hypothetical protein CVT25_006956 [Psilocybe cyanescens]